MVIVDAPPTMDAATLEPEVVGEGAGGEDEPQAIDEPNSSAVSVIRTFILGPLFIEGSRQTRCLASRVLLLAIVHEMSKRSQRMSYEISKQFRVV